MLRTPVALALALANAAIAQVCVEPIRPNEKILSPDGKVTLYVQYDQNAWTLLEGDPLRVRWRRVFTDDWKTMDWMPAGPRVNNEGWIVAGNSIQAAYAVIEPKAGQMVMSFSMLKQIPPAEHRRYVDPHVMDHPPLWGGSHALWGFRDVGPDPYLAVRAWWGRRVIVDLRRGQFVEDQGEIHDACVKAEQESVMTALRAAVASGPPEPEGGWPDFFRVRRAAHLAGMLELSEALPLLQQIETWDYTDSTGGRGGGPPRLCKTNSTRQYAQLSIRRLGGEPAALPVFRFPHEEEAAFGARPPSGLARTSRERAESVRDIRIGMTGPEVVLIIGTPDAMPFNRRYFMEDWEYDFDAADPFTLRIGWKDEAVAETEVIRPPRWKQPLARDEQLLAGEQ